MTKSNIVIIAWKNNRPVAVFAVGRSIDSGTATGYLKNYGFRFSHLCRNQATATLPATPPRILTTPAQKSSAKFPIQEFRLRIITVPKTK